MQRLLEIMLIVSAAVLLSGGDIADAPKEFKVYLVAVSVKDINTAAAWYNKYLGFQFGEKKDYPESKVSIGIMTKGDFSLEIVQHKESVPVSKFIPDISNPAMIRGYGKIGYMVDNLDEIIKRMKADSVKFIIDPMQNKTSGSKMCIVLDNDGNWVQLMEKK
ncbi:MAG TPA: VOC family protein [Ignavibacteriaceae bacterium]|nr:VOC family protein [Ignavibacteriaceae bacterium]